MSVAIFLIPSLIVSINLLKTTPADATFSSPCSRTGTWHPGELNIYWFDVEQGDSQLIVGPAGRTLLIDLGETDWYATGPGTKAEMVADKIRSICGVGGQVHLDYVMASHHHLDHIGFAANPNDAAPLGSGIYRLLSPAGENFTVGALIDRDAGVWVDTNSDGDCDPGSALSQSAEVEWHNAGTLSPTALRWICWVHGPADQPDRSNIAGKVVTLDNRSPWPNIDLGPEVAVQIVQANGKGVKQADGVTPVSGDHTKDPIPISENDYTVAMKITFEQFDYATAGDANGEFASSEQPDFSYSDVEASLVSGFGDVDAMRANHHGSSHSNSSTFVARLAPETAFISCGENPYGHPGNRVLDAFRRVGADIYLSNNPCATEDADGSPIDYEGTWNRDGEVHLATTGGGSGYSVMYDAGTRSYSAQGEPPNPASGTSLPAHPSRIVINEYLMNPTGGGSEWVEVFNPTAESAAIGGLWIDDRPSGGAAPQQIPEGTRLGPEETFLFTLPGDFLDDTGTDSVRLLAKDGSRETVLDGHLYAFDARSPGRVVYRMGDGGSWCASGRGLATPGRPNPNTCS